MHLKPFILGVGSLLLLSSAAIAQNTAKVSTFPTSESNTQTITLAKDTRNGTTLVEPRRIRVPTTGQGCSCPYDRASNGSICGGRSAYSKPRGQEPACYQGETTSRQVWWNSPNNQFVDPNRTGQ